MDDDLEHHHFDDSPVDWMRAIAAALVTHTQLSEAAANSLSEAFPGVQELRLVLANGEQEVLECFSLIEGGEPNRRPLVCSFVLPPGEGSAAYEAMRLQSVIELDEATPDKDNLADWQYLVARHGIEWMLAAPLACKDSCAALSLVGAVLAGGVGAQPALSHAWLQEWSAEMAKTLAHASVQLMETSLDMLHAIFPPPALAQLLYNAVQSDQPSQAAALALASAGAAGTAGNPLQLRPGSQLPDGYSQLVFGSNPSTPQGLRTGSSQLLEDAQTSPFAALVAANNGELAPQSPLASLEMLPGGVSDARFNSLRLSAESLSSSQQGLGGGPGSAGGSAGGSTNLAGAAFNPFSAGGWGPVTASGGAGDPRRSPSVASHCSMARQASIASSAAAALLRQASLQSDTSFLFEDADSSKVMSPHGSEVAGFEDLLREDMAAHIQRRASADFAAQTPPQGSGMQHDSATSMDWLQAQRSNPPSPPPLGLPQGLPEGSPPPTGAAALASARRTPGQAAAAGAQAVSPREAQQGTQREGRESAPAVTAAAVAERLRPHKHQPQPQPASAPVSGAGSGATTSGAANSPILSPRLTSAPSRFSQQAQRDAQQALQAPRQQGQEQGKMSPTSWGPPLEQLPADSLGATASGRTLLLTPGLGSVAVAAAVAKMKEHAEKVAAAEGAGPGADCPASQDSFTPFADFKPGGEQQGEWGSQGGDNSGGDACSAGASPDPGQSPQGSPHAGTDSSNPGSRGSARQARQSASGSGGANGRSVSPSKASLRAEQQAQPQQLRPPVAGFGPRLAHRLEAIVEGSSSVESSGRLSSSPLPSFGSLITGSSLGAPGQGNGNNNPPQERLERVVEGPTSGEEASSPRTSSQRSSAEHPTSGGPPASAAAAAAAGTADVSQAPVGVPRHARDPGLQFQPLPAAAKPSSAPQLRQQPQPSRAPRGRSSGSRNGGTSSSRARSDGKLPGSSSSASAAPADVQQRWDLTFADPEREAGYKAWAAPRALAHDRLMGWTYAVVGAATLLGLLCRGMASRELLALHVIGSALYLLPGLAANISPRLWSAQRNYWLAGSRLVSTALYAAQLATTCSAEGPAVLGLLGESPTLCLLWRTGVSCMLMGALRLLLPLTIHVPVQLLSLWISTATLGLLSGHSSYTDCDDTDLPSALTLQGLLGFALPTLLVYLREARERQLFLGGKGRKE
ncbi:hypothetical protein N2152v2_006516 [Parachlorella kessleri]